MRKLAIVTSFLLIFTVGRTHGQGADSLVYVSGGPTKAIYKLDSGGLSQIFSAKKGFRPGSIAVDTQGRLFVCDQSNSEIHVLEKNVAGAWVLTTIYDQGTAAPPSPEQPVGCAFLGGNLYFAERSGSGGGHGVWVMPGAATTPTAGPFQKPVQLATVDAVGGDALVDIARTPSADLLVARGNDVLIAHPPLYDGFTPLIDLPAQASGLAVSSFGEIYVGQANGKIESYSASGAWCGTFVDAAPLTPAGMEFDLADTLIFSAPLRNEAGGQVRAAATTRRCDAGVPPPAVAGTVLASPSGEVDVAGPASAVSQLLAFENEDALTAKLCASLFTIDPEFVILNPDCQVTVTCREMPLAEFEARTALHFPDTTCMKTPISSGGNCTEMIVKSEGECLGGLTAVEWIFFVTENVTAADRPGFLYSNGTVDPPFVAPFFDNILSEFRGEVPDLPNDPALKGERVDFGSSTVGVIHAPNRAPVADAGDDQTVQCGTFTLDGSGSLDRDPIDAESLTFLWTSDSFIPPGAEDDVTFEVDAADLGAGAHTYVLEVTDSEGLSDSDEVTLTVLAGGPAEIQSLEATPSSLWPPDHELVPISVAVAATDACGGPASCHISGVTMNEPDEGNGANTFPDWFFDPGVSVTTPGTLGLELRSERSEGSDSVGDARIYTIAVTCEGGSGNDATGTVNVTVVSNQGG